MFTYEPLYTTAQVRRIDADAIRLSGDDGYGLMQKAAGFALRCLRERWPKVRSVRVLAGPGNNGGDALVLARLACRQGFRVKTYLLGHKPTKLSGAAAQAYADFVRSGLILEEELPAASLHDGDLIIDGLFGTGFARALGGEALDWVEQTNAAREHGIPVLALDIPSGLNADTGRASGSHVQADLTASFVARKFGHDLGHAIDACGELRFSALGVHPASERAIPVVARRLRGVSWPRRASNAHKGSTGHLVILAGQKRFAGASVLAAHGALRAGVGKVSLVADSDPLVHPSLWPEVMRPVFRNSEEFISCVSPATALCLGPGLGRDDDHRALLLRFAAKDVAQVWDADALWALAQWPELQSPRSILTPHPGEAGMLLKRSTAEIQNDRLSALLGLVERYRCTVVLKGARTLVGAPGITPVVIPQGNPSMAVGGMGDVLAGVIASLCAQGFTANDAAIAGAWLLASTADEVARHRGYSLLPHDILNGMRVITA